MKKILSISFFSLLMFAVTSCKKTEGFTGLTDNKPAIPVTVVNLYDYIIGPTVKASKAENKITITLQIPESSGRTIKEVNKIAAQASASYSAIYNGTTVGTGTTQLWSNTTIPVNSTTYTFTTTFDEYKTKKGITAAIPSNAMLANDFYFLLTLDNGEKIIPPYTRVWVVD
jgi:hypothetical protein